MSKIIEVDIVDKNGEVHPIAINIDHIVYIRPYYNNKSNTSAAIFTNEKMFVTDKIYSEIVDIINNKSLTPKFV